MKQLITALTLLGASASVYAAGGGALYDFTADTGNEASVQRGARNFMNYCSGCHSVKYLRYNRLARDNDIPESQLGALMFTSDKPGDTIVTAMPAEQAAKWFGQAPPDLSLTTRARGEDWVYSFLKTFYLDSSKATGVNNKQLPGASMPHVLGGLQGYQVLHKETAPGESADAHGDGHAGPSFELAVEGSMDEKAYDDFVSDLVNFLAYAAEPGKKEMHDRGFWVLLYLLFLIPLTYLIKLEFWKDVH